MEYKIIVTTHDWACKRNHTEHLYLETSEPVRVEQYNTDTGEPAALHIGSAAVIYFEADEVSLQNGA